MSTFSLGFAELLLAGRMRQAGCSETWTFEISLPALPPRRSFLIAAGLEQAVAMLERLAESGPDLAGLDGARLPAPLDMTVLKHVAALRFTGHVEAVPEGTVIFAGEPVVRLRAPAPEAVLVGAALVGLLRSQTAVATKAARLVLAAGGKPVYEVGVRSAGREAVLLAARSAHVGGASATSNAFASIDFGLPTFPVVPLSLVTALGGNIEGLEQCGVMVDGALASEGEAALAALSDTPRAVVLDAGTKGLAERVKSLRAGIQSLGWRTTKVLVGGRVDEDVIDEIEGAAVAVDGYCVGGELVVAVDSPCIAFDYELVEREIGSQKIPLPRRDGGIGRRSVWRRREAGRFKSDTVQPETKAPPSGGMPLLVRVMEKGRRMFRAPSLSELRVLCNSQLSMLDPAITRRNDPATYTVSITIEPRKTAEPPKKAAEPKAAPKSAPKPAAKGEPLRADEARRRALSQIDDSADFTAVSGAFESVVAANLGDDPEQEAPAEASEETVEASPDEGAVEEVVEEVPSEEAPDDSGDAVAEEAPQDDSQQDEASEGEATEESPVEASAEEPVEPSAEEMVDESGEAQESDATEPVEPSDEEPPAPTLDQETSEGDAVEPGDEETSETGESDESVEPSEPAESEEAPDEMDAEPESHDLVGDLTADGLLDSATPAVAPKSAAASRGAPTSKTAAVAKAPPASKHAATKAPAPKAAAPKPPAAAPKAVAPKPAAPAKKPVAPVKPAAAARPKDAPKSVAAPKPAAVKAEATEPALPSFGAEPFSSNGTAEPVASNSNPLLAAAARLRSMQRGEPTPAAAVAPSAVESAPAPVASASTPSGNAPANPLLAAALRLKSMRGS